MYKEILSTLPEVQSTIVDDCRRLSLIVADCRQQKALDFSTSELRFRQISYSFLIITHCRRLNPRDRRQKS
uniref:Uncharacterized protein n=1 Tax=Romanomermis culicivorax TaxID=13658 RepID=A0A915JFG5_ROMCU